MDKIYFTYADIHNTVEKLARQISESDFKPDLIVAIGTGGFIPARILKTFLKLPILTVGIAFYGHDNLVRSAPEKIQWIDEAEKKIKGKSVLLVDEVDDTRTTLEYCLGELLDHHPKEIAVAVLHKKNKVKIGTIPPAIQRYWVGEELEDPWICYPWDALNIEEHEQKAKGE